LSSCSAEISENTQSKGMELSVGKMASPPEILAKKYYYSSASTQFLKEYKRVL